MWFSLYLEAAGVSVRGCEVEWRHPCGALVDGDVGVAVRQEALHHLGVTVLRRQVQRRPTVGVCGDRKGCDTCQNVSRKFQLPGRRSISLYLGSHPLE